MAMDHSHSKDKVGDGDSLQVSSQEESLHSFRSSIGSKIPGTQPSSSVWLSRKKRNRKEFGEVDHAFDMSQFGTTAAGSPQKVGKSILINEENQLNTVLDSITNTPLKTARSRRIGTSLVETVDLDAMISRLLDAGYSSKVTKSVCLRTAEIIDICLASEELLLSQPTLLELSSPVKIVGDIRGQYTDLIRLFEMSGFPPASNYLFLGNYVNRGKQSLETILLLLCYKLKYPGNVFLLRGNYESANATRMFGFYEECKQRCNLKIWKTFINVFNCLPIASIVAEKTFCVHSGLSPSLSHIDDIRWIARPTDVPDYGLLKDLLGSYPLDMDEDWESSQVGIGYTFGTKVTMNFLQRHNFDMICRGHTVLENGYEFSQDRMLLTLFSAPHYRGEFDNRGAIMSVSHEHLCSFELLKPLNSEGNKRKILNSPVYGYDQDDKTSITDDDFHEILESSFEQGINKGAPSSQMSTTGTSNTVPSNVSRAVDAQTSPPDLHDISQLDLASDLFKAILSLFIMITQRAAKTKHSRKLRSELERLFLWGDALSIPDGQLDEVITESSDLCQTVLSTLYELGKVINDNLLGAVGGTTRSEESDGSAESVLTDLAESDIAQQLQRLLKKAAPVRVTLETTADFESLSDGDSMRYDLDEILDDVAIYNDCLMDLSLAVESPIVDIDPFGMQ